MSKERSFKDGIAVLRVDAGKVRFFRDGIAFLRVSAGSKGSLKMVLLSSASMREGRVLVRADGRSIHCQWEAAGKRSVLGVNRAIGARVIVGKSLKMLEVP